MKFCISPSLGSSPDFAAREHLADDREMFLFGGDLFASVFLKQNALPSRTLFHDPRCALVNDDDERVLDHGGRLAEQPKPSMAAAGETFCAFAILHRAESRWFAIPGKPRSAYTPSPVSHAVSQTRIIRTACTISRNTHVFRAALRLPQVVFNQSGAYSLSGRVANCDG
jgi:hypothetical protein